MTTIAPTISTSPAIPARRSFQRGAFDFVAIFACLLLTSVISFVSLWHMWYDNRIYPGVTISGVAVGGLTRPAAVRQLTNSVTDFPLPPITLNDGAQQWALEPSQLSVNVNWLDAVNHAYLVGRQGDWIGKLIDQFSTALNGAAIPPQLAFDSNQMRSLVAEIAEQKATPAQSGVQFGNITIPAQAGLAVDLDGTLQRLLTALQTATPNQPINVSLYTQAVQPADAPATGAAAKPAITLANTELILRDNRSGLEFAIDRAQRTRLIAQADPFTVDELAVLDLLEDWATQIDLPARDARLYFDPGNGALSVLQPSLSGRRLDRDATYSAILSALQGDATHAPLAVVDVAPAVDSNRIAEMGINELVVSGSTFFKGSSAERIHNIRIGAAKFEGAVIPPNGVFSFNRYVEDVTTANGFGDALVISGDATVNGVGGGICQVSTTIFRAAFEGGFPLVERTNHAYVVRWYGDPGMDATIYTPYLDFKFRNDTGAYLLLQPAVDANNGVITFNFYGTKPARTVTIGKPVYSDTKPAPPPEYTVDETLEPGQKKQIDWENKGMTVKIERTINENGETRKEELVSKYLPWQAKWLVAPGTVIPTPIAPAAAPTTDPAAPPVAPPADPAATPIAPEPAPTATP